MTDIKAHHILLAVNSSCKKDNEIKGIPEFTLWMPTMIIMLLSPIRPTEKRRGKTGATISVWPIKTPRITKISIISLNLK